MKRIKIFFLMLCAFVFVNNAYSSSFKYSVNTQKLQPVEIDKLNISRIVENAVATDIEENWSMDYSHEIIIIPMADLNIPIEISKPTVTLKHKEKGQFVFSEGKVRSVTRNPIVTYEHKAGSEIAFRPTLYISLQGLRVDSEVDSWQAELQDMLEDDILSSQYKHFLVKWDSSLSLGTQVDDLASVVGDFLNNKVYAWDVVIIGYSRGGIFAHELSSKIIGHNKIKNLHTFLLDPTASTFHSDRYPNPRTVPPVAGYFGSLYYDGQKFIDEINMSLGTDGDRNIIGYDNYGRNDHLFNSSHSDFGTNWVAAGLSGLAGALVDIKSKKVPGSFIADGDSGEEFVRIKANKNIDFNGNIDITDGNISLFGDLSAGGLSLVNIEAAVGKDGVDIAGGTAIATSHIIINEDQLEASQSTLLSSYSASVSSEGLSANVSLIFTSASASINSDEITINITVGDQTIGGNADTGGAVAAFVACGVCAVFSF